MCPAVRSTAALECLLWLMSVSCVYSIFDPPCMSQLGLKYDSSPGSLTFDLAVSSEDADNIRLNAPKAWTPLNMSTSFLEVNISEPVLLTALQVQGDPLLSGRVTDWLLETSLDCESYRTENYSLDFARPSPALTETVLLKNIEFVSCIRLRPTHYTGQTAALRLELLGCAVNDNSRCRHEVYPSTEIWMDGGTRQLSYDHEVVLVWVKVLLEFKSALDTHVTLSYSRSCETWKQYELSDMNIVSVTSSDQTSRWLTIEMEIPARVRCLRISPPLGATLTEVHTSACSLNLPARLRELGNDVQLNTNEKGTEVSAAPAAKDIETTTILPTTETSAYNLNVLPRQSTETSFTTEPNVEGETNSSVPQVYPSHNDSASSNSSASTAVSLFDTLSSFGPNGLSNNNTLTGINSSVQTTTEEQVETSNTSKKDDLYNNSESQNSATESSSLSFMFSDKNGLNKSNNDIMVNDSAITASWSSDTFLQPNSDPTTGSSDLDKLTENGNTTSGLQDKEYNKTTCGVRNPAIGLRRKRVVAGHVNSPGEWPWLVSMHFLIEFEFTRKSGFKHTCGASLVAPGWVITAAHCFSDELLVGLSNLTNWRVYMGMHDLALGDNNHYVQERLIETVYNYPNYNITAEPLLYDLVLVKLNESVEVNEMVSPVCLDNETDMHDEETPCFVSGWGQISLTTPGSRFPHTASLSTMTLSKCKDMYDKLPDNNDVKLYARIEPPVLCAAVGDQGEDACQGDSGGPLMCQRDGLWYQAGIVAGGYLCGHKATPGLYTRIAYYSNWIRNTIDLVDGQ